jgi:hypothetical protein
MFLSLRQKTAFLKEIKTDRKLLLMCPSFLFHRKPLPTARDDSCNAVTQSGMQLARVVEKLTVFA